MMRAHAAIRWTKAMDDTVRTMRASGALWTEIGRTLGYTSTTIANRAKLLGIYELPGVFADRAAALTKAQQDEEKRNAAVRAHHAARVAERARAKALGVSPERLANRLATALAQSNRKPEAPPVRAAADYTKPIPLPKTCQWPLNDARPWLFCDAAGTLVGKPYCAVHHALACVQVAQPKQEAAE